MFGKIRNAIMQRIQLRMQRKQCMIKHASEIEASGKHNFD